jgi:hypothetical protein
LYKGRHEYCSVVLEAMADYDLWIWHTFFDMAGSHNEINMLQRSPVFSKLVEGHAPPCNYEINGHNIYQRILSSRWYLSNMGDICEDNLGANRSEELPLC